MNKDGSNVSETIKKTPAPCAPKARELMGAGWGGGGRSRTYIGFVASSRKAAVSLSALGSSASRTLA